MRGSYQPFSSWKSARNMWSVKIWPKPSSPSLGFFLSVVALLIRMGSIVMMSLLEDHGLAIKPEHLPVHVRDLAERDVVLHRVHQDRHHVPAVTTRFRELLEPALALGGVTRRLDPADSLDLLALDGVVDLEDGQRPLLGHHVLVHAHHRLLAAIVHELIAIRGVGDLALR